MQSRLSQQLQTMLTEVVERVAGSVEGPSVELEADDGEYDDGKEQEESNVDQGSDRFPYRAHHNLKAWREKRMRLIKYWPWKTILRAFFPIITRT